MNQSFKHSPISDRQIETVLNRLHKEANQQIGSLFLHYLPKLPSLLLGKGLQWDQTKTDFYRDKYIPIEPKPYVDFLQNPDHGYCSSTINLKGGTEFSVKVNKTPI